MHKQKILISGASGMIGSALSNRLRKNGAIVYEYSHRRHSQIPDELDVLINLAGENIGARRWSRKQKREIFESRIARSAELIERLSKIAKPPALVLSASAIGYYGDRGQTILTEEDAPGKEFLSSLAVQWEEIAQHATHWSAIVTIMRFGIVLAAKGGALAKMLPIFRLGLGGVIGSGEQYMSWISLEDLLRAIEFLLEKRLVGGVNVCSPNSVTNREFTTLLADNLRRPSLLPLPTWLVRLLFGEMGDALLLSSTRVYPRVLIREGFTFLHPQLSPCFAQLLKAPSAQ